MQKTLLGVIENDLGRAKATGIRDTGQGGQLSEHGVIHGGGDKKLLGTLDIADHGGETAHPLFRGT